MLDSATTAHTAPHGNRLFDSNRQSKEIKLADDSTFSLAQIGKMPAKLKADSVRTTVRRAETIHIPNMKTSLLSVLDLVIKILPSSLLLTTLFLSILRITISNSGMHSMTRTAYSTFLNMTVIQAV